MSKKTSRPKKPHPDFPLIAHRNSQWSKKLRARLHYFGIWSDPQAAVQEYLRVRDDLQAGRIPTPATSVVTLADVCNTYVEPAELRYNAGELMDHPTWNGRLHCREHPGCF